MRARGFGRVFSLALGLVATSCAAMAEGPVRSSVIARATFEQLDHALAALESLHVTTSPTCPARDHAAIDAAAREALRVHLLVAWFRELPAVERYDARVQSRMWAATRVMDSVVLDAEDILLGFDALVASDLGRASGGGRLRSSEGPGPAELDRICPSVNNVPVDAPVDVPVDVDARVAVAGFDEKQRRALRRSTHAAIAGLDGEGARAWIARRTGVVEKSRREVALSLRRDDRRERLGTGARALGLVPRPTPAGLTILDVDETADEPLSLVVAALLVRLRCGQTSSTTVTSNAP